MPVFHNSLILIIMILLWLFQALGDESGLAQSKLHGSYVVPVLVLLGLLILGPAWVNQSFCGRLGFGEIARILVAVKQPWVRWCSFSSSSGSRTSVRPE